LCGSRIRFGRRSQIGDNGGNDIRAGCLRSRIAIRQRANRHQTENRNQAKGGETESES
jgi:hypothetical protein